MSAAQTREIAVGAVKLGGAHGLFLIAGPCVIESENHARSMAERLAALCAELKLPYIFKSSYDKANRTSGKSYRGPGLKEGLRILKKIKDDLKLPILTDVHAPDQVAPAAEVADILQIPAFLSRQTDLLTAAGKSGRVVNIKKGQFVSPWEMQHAIEKVAATGNEKILVTERGTSFGYNNLVVDMRSFPILRGFGCPVVFDVTHSLQLPGGEGNQSGGQREFAEPLARAAVAAGVDGLFMEVHDAPDRALSDPATQLPLAELKPFLQKLLSIRAAVESDCSAMPLSFGPVQVRSGWVPQRDDIEAVRRLLESTHNKRFVAHRIQLNVSGPPPTFSREGFWRVLLGCLLTIRQKSGPDSSVARILRQDPFPLSLERLPKKGVRTAVFKCLTDFGGIRFTKTIAERAEANLAWLDSGGWDLVEKAFNSLREARSRPPRIADVRVERDAANFADEAMKGLGPKQSRNLWQWLGLTRYEIPIDSRVCEWLNDNTSHSPISTASLGERRFYESILDDIHRLCVASDVLPCVFDGAVWSSFDREWRPDELDN